MKTITAFITSDNRLFETEIEAETYEMMLSKQGIIENYLESGSNVYRSGAHRTVARSTIVGWEVWKVKNESQ